jgi:hypothetical protein
MDAAWGNHAEQQFMTASMACQTCSADLPVGACYCPGCGTPTPTGISGDSGVGVAVQPDNTQALAYRDRLQEALGSHFELRHELGRGGFAEVHAAWDVRLKRHVAVKTLRYDLADHFSSDLLDRFQREAEAMARLSHPHIMPIYAVGEGNGIVYFIMPLATGKSLSAKLGGATGLPIGEARRITVEIAQALEHAHGAGVVHRDVKPDNIMLEGDDERVLVTDFGIAKAAAAGTSDLTGTGMAIGTPAYMSPEQATGENEIDHRADLYSLGVVAFQMLTGQLPFGAPTALALMAKQATEIPPKVAARRPNCPRIFAEAVDRCLGKEPNDRFGSAAELRTALEARMSGGVAQPATALLPHDEIQSKPTRDPLGTFRLTIVLCAAVTVAAVLVDLLSSPSVDFAPLVLAASAILVAIQYSRLWMVGHTWREALRYSDGLAGEPRYRERATGPSIRRQLAQLDVPESFLQTARAERATIVRLLNQVSQTEREYAAAVLPALDEVLARMAALVERTESIGKAIAERQRAMDSSSQGGKLAAPDERAIQKLEGDRTAITESLESHLSAVQDLRGTVESAVQLGVRETAEKISDSVQSLSHRVREVS